MHGQPYNEHLLLRLPRGWRLAGCSPPERVQACGEVHSVLGSLVGSWREQQGCEPRSEGPGTRGWQGAWQVRADSRVGPRRAAWPRTGGRMAAGVRLLGLPAC